MATYVRAQTAVRVDTRRTPPDVLLAIVMVVMDVLLVAGRLPRPAGLAAAAVAVTLIAVRGQYDLTRRASWITIAWGGMSSVALALVAALALARELGLDAAALDALSASAWSVPMVAVWHVAVADTYARLVGASTKPRRVIVLGTDESSREAAEEFARQGCEVLGYVGEPTEAAPADQLVLGPIARLDQLVEAYAADEIVVGPTAGKMRDLRQMITRGFERPIHVQYAPELGELRLPSRFEVARVGRSQYVRFPTAASVAWTKRAMDIVLSAVLLALGLPVFVAIALAIKLNSPGPVFYTQVRVGKNRRFFNIVKFRSMQIDAEARLADLRDRNEVSGPMFKIRKDPRITSVGRFLRRTSLDELPQLINVLRGEMSLVGPRPPLASEVEQYRNWEIGRLRAVPGITGLWQVSGRTELSFEEMVRLDLNYVRNWSLALDLLILVRTLPAVIASRGAY